MQCTWWTLAILSFPNQIMLPHIHSIKCLTQIPSINICSSTEIVVQHLGVSCSLADLIDFAWVVHWRPLVRAAFGHILKQVANTSTTHCGHVGIRSQDRCTCHVPRDVRSAVSACKEFKRERKKSRQGWIFCRKRRFDQKIYKKKGVLSRKFEKIGVLSKKIEEKKIEAENLISWKLICLSACSKRLFFNS